MYKLIEILKIIAYICGALLIIKVIYNLFFKNESELDVNESRLSLSKDILRVRTRTIHVAMRSEGTDEQIIIDSLEGLNSEDIKFIYNEFGLKGYILTGGYDGFLDNFFFPELDLLGWIREEIDKDDDEFEYLQIIFAKAGLKL